MGNSVLRKNLYKKGVLGMETEDVNGIPVPDEIRNKKVTSTTTKTYLASDVETDPFEVLRIMEKDPTTFTTGRRNNDMVNWFILKRITSLLQGEPAICSVDDILESLHDDFAELVMDMSKAQVESLKSWELPYSRYAGGAWRTKLNQLVGYYGTKREVNALLYLWLPMVYRTVE